MQQQDQFVLALIAVATFTGMLISRALSVMWSWL